MHHLNFYQFLREGLLTGLSASSKESDIIRQFGQPGEIEDYGRKGKYLHYDYFRIGLTDDCLADITCFFYNTKADFTIQCGEETYEINEFIPLTRILYLLNEWKIPWEIPFQESNLDYAVVKLGNGNKIYYYLYNSKLERITRNLSA